MTLFEQLVVRHNLLHGMERYSEDMDFSLLEPDPNFRFEDYFPAVVEEFKLAGFVG